MTIALIGDEEAVLGFKLAGLTNATLFQENKTREILEKCLDAKILIATEDVAIHVKKQEWFIERFKGVLVEIPTKRGSSGNAMREISRLFENAIGVKIKE